MAGEDEVGQLRSEVARLTAELDRRNAGLVGGGDLGTATPATTPDILFAAIDRTRMPMVVSDPNLPDNPIVFANRAFIELSGFPADELIGRNCRFLQGRDTDREQVAKLRAAIAARREVTVDLLNYRRDGTPFINELYVAPVFDREGEVRYFFGSQLDLTRYEIDREATRRSDERYRSLFETIDAGFCVFEMIFDGDKPVDYRFVEVNPAFEAQTGIVGAAGRRMREIAPMHEQRWFDIYGDVARTRKGIRFEEEAAALGRHYEVHAYPVGDPDRNLVAALFTDVTQRKRAEADLKALNDTLESQVADRTAKLMAAEETARHAQKMEAIGQLTGGVAHDFNNLLTIIRSAAEFLQRDGLSDDRRRRYVSAIVDTSERAARLTGQLLAFARRQPLKAEVFDVGERMRAIGDLIKPLIGDRIAVGIEDCPSGACRVEADPGQFETALVNLAVNGRDAMDGAGTLRLSARRSDGIPPMRHHDRRPGTFVAIAVQDSGSGIPAANLDRIFEPFFTTKDTGKGTGLGLSQVFGFAKQSGGDIGVETSPQGTIFTLYLPAREVPAQQETTSAGASPTLPDDACILVVEDNAEVGRFSTELLHDLGFRTLWVEDAATALAKLDGGAELFDLVFSDVMMPGMNGLELGREIRRRFPRLPVVLTSGYSDVIAQEGTYGFDLVRKPYSIETLSQTLAAAFSTAR